MRREYGYSIVLLLVSGLTGLLAIYLGGAVSEWPWFYTSVPLAALGLAAASFLMGLDRSPAGWLVPVLLLSSSCVFTLMITLAGAASVVSLQGITWPDYSSAMLASVGVMLMLSLASVSAWTAGYLLSPLLRYEERPRTVIYFVRAERVERFASGRLSGAAEWLRERLEALAEALGDLVWRLLGY